MKYHFIMNPSAGKGNQLSVFEDKIREICEKEGLDYDIHVTKGVGEATLYVKDILSSDNALHRFYAFGGDGTFSEVVNGVFSYENAEVGLIPTGTGNDFCKNFTEKSNFFDIEKQLNGKSEKIDVLKYNDKYCVNMLNIGFDCNVVCNTLNIKKNRFIPNKLTYVAALVVTLFKSLYSHQKITVNGETIVDRDILLTAIGNGSFYGGGFHATPYASLTDSTLDISIVEKISRLKFISLVSSYKKGTHLKTKAGKKCVSYIRATSLKMEFDTPTKICVDGEIETASTIDISVIPRGISFIIPKGSSLNCSNNEFVSDQKYVNLAR